MKSLELVELEAGYKHIVPLFWPNKLPASLLRSVLEASRLYANLYQKAPTNAFGIPLYCWLVFMTGGAAELVALRADGTPGLPDT